MLSYANTDFTKLTDLEKAAQCHLFPFTFEHLRDHHAMEAAGTIEMRALDICHFVKMLQDKMDSATGLDHAEFEEMYSLTRAIIAMAVAIGAPADALHERVKFLEQELAKAAHREPAAA
jgi:hypothetical protein